MTKPRRNRSSFNARYELLVRGVMTAARLGKYELTFHPHLQGSIIIVQSDPNDELCGIYSMADAPEKFVTALARAAVKLENKEIRK